MYTPSTIWRSRCLNKSTILLLLGVLLVGLLCIGCDSEQPIQPPVESPAELPEDDGPDGSDDPGMTPLVDHDIVIKASDGGPVFWNELTDKEFVIRGVNYFWIVPHDGGFQDRFFALDEFDATRVAEDFRLLSAKGYNTVRVFFDTCSSGLGCIGRTDGIGLDSRYIDNLAETIKIAEQEGIYLILTSNDLPDDGGYWDISNAGSNDNFAAYRNAHYLTQNGIESAKKYWGDLLSALVDRAPPLNRVLAWSLLNEQWYFRFQPPFSLSSGEIIAANGMSYDMANSADKKRLAVEGMVHYINEVRKTIDEYDPNGLVTMGFFVPDYPNALRSGDFRYVETAGLLPSANLDFFDFHTYPGEVPLDIFEENFGMMGYNQKPIIMGEVGAFLDRYFDSNAALSALQNWQAQSCEFGFDGWLYWGMYRAPEGVGDASWGFMDGEMELLEGLAPINYSDACATELLPPENLALGKPVSASATLAGEAPEMAVDGRLDTQWGSGDLPPQWISIDLGEETQITGIDLHVAQFPNGLTEHHLEASNDESTWSTLKVFNGETIGGEVLRYEVSEPVSFRYIRVRTTASPSWVSWKEISVFGL